MNTSDSQAIDLSVNDTITAFINIPTGSDRGNMGRRYLNSNNNNDSNYNGNKDNYNNDNDSNVNDSNNEDNTNSDSNNEDSNNEDSNDNDSNVNNQDDKKRNRNSNNNSADEDHTEKETKAEEIKEFGQMTLENNKDTCRIHLLSIIGEVEGHENLPQHSKTTKYEHILPELAEIEDNQEVDGLLVLLNTAGGDIDAGLAIAEMISSLSKPTVSLVLGGSHSIGVPLAVSTDYSFIVPTGTMLVHPVRMTGMVIGAPQTYEYFKRIQDRITTFASDHSKATKERLEEMMMETGEMTKDLGTILIGSEAVEEGLIDEVGGINRALKKLHEMINEDRAGKSGR